jgi:hypothetical protein
MIARPERALALTVASPADAIRRIAAALSLDAMPPLSA